MNLKERVEKLQNKSKAQPYCVLPPEERELIDKAGFKNVLCLSFSGVWQSLATPRWRDDPGMSYVLTESYQPKQEDKYYEVKWVNGLLWVDIKGNNFSPEYVSRKRGFRWFCRKTQKGLQLSLTELVRTIEYGTGESVVARFRGDHDEPLGAE